MFRHAVLIVLLTMLVGGVSYVLVTASCRPQPYCNYETCLHFGTYCYGDWYPCAEHGGDGQQYQDLYYCPSYGYIWDWEGYLCNCYQD